jgi:hypothetical protein
MCRVWIGFYVLFSGQARKYKCAADSSIDTPDVHCIVINHLRNEVTFAPEVCDAILIGACGAQMRRMLKFTCIRIIHYGIKSPVGLLNVQFEVMFP